MILIVNLKWIVQWMLYVILITEYQATIFPKENVKDKKKFILEFGRLDGN